MFGMPNMKGQSSQQIHEKNKAMNQHNF